MMKYEENPGHRMKMKGPSNRGRCQGILENSISILIGKEKNCNVGKEKGKKSGKNRETVDMCRWRRPGRGGH